MKKLIKASFLFIISSILLLISCSKTYIGEIYTVTFDVSGISDQSVKKGEKVVKPTDPSKGIEYIFKGWYTDNVFLNKYDFDQEVNSNINLYAYFDKAFTINNNVLTKCLINDENITIPEGITSIGDYAFDSRYSLKSITIPNSLTSIGDSAFFNCTSLRSIVIPSNITNIGVCAFENCLRLVEVYNLSKINMKTGSTDNGHIGYYAIKVHKSLDEKSIITKDDNGYIFAYSDNKGYLLGYEGISKELILPKNFTYDNQVINSYEISRFSFCQSSITSIIIPESVTIIGEAAFSMCMDLRNIKITKSVTNIGDYALAACLSLENITFDGTKEEWNTISKESNWKDSVPATKVHCSNGDVDL